MAKTSEFYINQSRQWKIQSSVGSSDRVRAIKHLAFHSHRPHQGVQDFSPAHKMIS